jgi:hypothetical protein
MLICSRKTFALLFAGAFFGASSRALPAADAPTIAFVPLDDRPVTLQLPVMLGRIAGQRILVPPRSAIGSYLEPGRPNEILRWLGSPQTERVSALVASTDMVAYGGLVASRLPGVAAEDAVARLRSLAAFKNTQPAAFVQIFGTIMRLAPTGVPRLGPASKYYATGDTVDLIAQYANLPDPPQTDEQRALAARLRERIGPATLDAYLATRARNRYVDEYALQFAAEGGFDRIVLGQDDAGPTGLHLRDLEALRALVQRFSLGDRASIEPGADELGMAMLAAAFARDVGWRPTVNVIYSQFEGEKYQDPLEFAPVGVTIDHLIHLCGARAVPSGGDIQLYVRLPDPAARGDDTFEKAIADDVKAGRSAAVADLSFLSGQPGEDQQQLANNLIADGVAGKIDSFASWNTTANTVGTALAAAIAAGAGRRAGRYDARAHAEFMLDRYIDDYAFHQFVRPEINAELRARGIDTTLLAPDVALEASHQNRALLWRYALDLLARIYPEYHDGGLTITLPWDRTFETQIDVRL